MNTIIIGGGEKDEIIDLREANNLKKSDPYYFPKDNGSNIPKYLRILDG